MGLEFYLPVNPFRRYRSGKKRARPGRLEKPECLWPGLLQASANQLAADASKKQGEERAAPGNPRFRPGRSKSDGLRRLSLRWPRRGQRAQAQAGRGLGGLRNPGASSEGLVQPVRRPAGLRRVRRYVEGAVERSSGACPNLAARKTIQLWPR
jgi:hypothetical protein